MAIIFVALAMLFSSKLYQSHPFHAFGQSRADKIRSRGMPKKSRRAVSVDVPYNVHTELERARQLLKLDRQLAFDDASGSFVTDWPLFFPLFCCVLLRFHCLCVLVGSKHCQL